MKMFIMKYAPRDYCRAARRARNEQNTNRALVRAL